MMNGPMKRKNAYVLKPLEFLSFEDNVAVLFSATSILFTVKSLLITGLFVLFQDTPIVTANNRNLSYIILICLILSLLSVFLFLERPVHITYMLIQISFGITFTTVISSILAKTIMVCIAFKATKPGSFWRKWVGVRLPNSVMVVCSSVQVINGIIWLVVSPPFQESDMHSYPGKVIVQCNEGCVWAFNFMLGYMGLLSTVSFLLVFMVRTLPDIFNEVKYITFSMPVFCTVWICAIPAYLSSKGEKNGYCGGFAILTSSTGILSCIFFPKCYSMLLRPKMNKKRILLHKHSS